MTQKVLQIKYQSQGFPLDKRTGVTFEALNAHPSEAPDFTLQWRVHVPFYKGFIDQQIGF